MVPNPLRALLHTDSAKWNDNLTVPPGSRPATWFARKHAPRVQRPAFLTATAGAAESGPAFGSARDRIPQTIG